MTVDLLRWLEEPSEQRGVYFAGGAADWDFHSHAALAAATRSAAAHVAEHRRPDAPVVAILLPTGPAFLAAFFGTLLAGATPCPLAPPSIMRGEDYTASLTAKLRAAEPGLAIVDAAFRDHVAGAAAAAGLALPVIDLADAPPAAPAQAAAAAELGLLQFTSGSTGRPKGVRVRRENLERNLAMLRDWLRLADEDTFATWLPLFHDMGLIGLMLLPVATGSTLYAMSPEQFLRRPARWLECFGRHGATIGCAPTFGYGYAHARVRDADLEGMDFSRWRIGGVAAERLDAAVMRRFVARLEPLQARPALIVPAYGLAEATLLVAGHAVGELARAVKVDWDDLRFGAEVGILATASVDDAAGIGDGVGWVVASGQTLAGAAVTVADDEGRELPPGHLGEIVVRGGSVADGYIATSTDDHARRFVAGTLRTGDAGFLLGDDLFVVGRIGDSLKVRGRTVYVEELENRLATLPGIDLRRCVTFAGREARGDAVVALVEREPGAWVEPVLRTLAAEVGAAVRVYVLSAPRGAIRRTSSGKPRRRSMWSAFLSRDLGGKIVAESGAISATERVARTATASAA